MKDSFLQQVTRDMIARVGLNGLENYTFVFPMQRAGLFVKRYLCDYIQESKQTAPIVLPHFTTIDLLADSLCKLHSDDEIASVFRLYAAYKAHVSQDMPIDAFYGWGQQLLTDISNIDMALLDIDKMIQMTADAGQLDAIQIDDEVRERLEKLLRQQGNPHSVREFFVSLWRELPAIYTDFKNAESQDDVQVGTRGARTRWVVENFSDDIVQRGLQGRHFVFVGFNYLLGAERQLMTLIRDREPEQTLFYWDYNADFTIPNGIFDFMPREIERFGNALPIPQSEGRFLSPKDGSSFPPSITAIAFGSASGQAQYVHQWLHEHHHPGQQTAIVVADESILPQVVYALPAEADWGHINITKGYPLRNTRIFAETVKLLDEAVEKKTSVQDLIQTVAHNLETVYKCLRQHTEDRWLFVLIDEAYYQSQLVLRELLSLIKKDDFVRAELTDIHLCASLIRRRLEMVSIPFHGEPITDIQIIGVLETRLLDFDNVLILNVEEGVVPNTSADRSFLPLDLRKEYRMQTRDEESKIYGYNFFRLLRRAEHVTLTFSEATTDTGKKSMSRFLMQLLTSPDYTVTRRMVTEPDHRIPIEATDAVFNPEQGDRRPDHLSPSAISDYIECPKEFYLKHIRHIRTADEESVLFIPSTLGTLVHGVLESVYRQKKNGTEPDWDKALDDAYTAANAKFHEHHRDIAENPYIREDHAVENHAILEMAKRVVKKDSELDEMENIWLEKPVEMKVGDLTLLGVIDRLDRVKAPNEYIRILDYKTGSYKAEKMRVDSMDELFTNPDKRYPLQTLIYCEILRHQKDAPHPELPICPELFYTKQPSEERRLLLPVKNGEEELEKKKKPTYEPMTNYVEQLAAAFQPKLFDTIQTIMTATAFPMVDRKQCEDSHCYCPFHLLCGREKKSFD